MRSDAGRAVADPPRPLRLALLGFGVIGQGVLRTAAGRSWLETVAVIVRRPQLDGHPARDLVAEAPPGLLMTTNGPGTLESTRPDVVLVATRSTLADVLPHLRVAASAGSAVACTAEDLGYIEPSDGPEAAAVFALADQRQVPIVQIGLNPGFLLDVWPLGIASVTSQIERIDALRVVDVSAYGPQVRVTLGIGYAQAAFEEALAGGRMSGHRGFRESLRLIGTALGRPLESTTLDTQPILAQRDRTLPGGRIRRGKTAGVRQVATGSTDGDAWLRAEMTVSVALDELDAAPVDRLRITGTPNVTVEMSPGVPSVQGTLARIVNALPAISRLPPGVHPAFALGLTPVWLGDNTTG
jgi:4-hydroxy-tetrahydrodipicolinate reductase